jgi:wyosine [tRNA(Phe)-imidazoG37] synthetase (radical SAM superfamily)
VKPRQLDFSDHRRDLGANTYVYAVVSRRAGGLSIGVNLNPDKVCNFDCPYCQVDRTTPGGPARVDVAMLDAELRSLLALAASGHLWEEAPFNTTAPEHRRVVDIAFAGDGEPTSPPEFPEAAAAARAARDDLAPGVPLRLLTNVTLVHRGRVRAALAEFDDLWCKLDAGTDDWFHRVDGTRFPYNRVLRNLRELAAERPIVIQAMFCALGEDRPGEQEIAAWTGRLRHIARQGTISEVQVYTVARQPADATVSALTAEELEGIAAAARAAGLNARAA